jgi:hypothetical protein
MAIWKSAFLHEFLDGNPQNFHAAPGELDVIPPVLIGPTPAADDLGFEIRPGQSMVYRFERPFEDVIGVDLHVDLLFPLQPGVQDFPLVSLGSGQVTLSMGHLEFIDPGFTPLTGRCRIGLAVDGALVEFSQLTVFHRRTTRFHVRWHTHGQAHVSHDGVLRAYQPAFAAGKAFTIDRLTIGGPVNAPPANAPLFLARRVYLKLLRRQDARNEIEQHVPVDSCGLPRTRCVKTIRALHDDLMDRSRRFMAEIVGELTQSWREGQAGSPFSPEAVRAHTAAVAAAKAFGAFVDQREPALATTCLQHVGEFLDVLAAANPAGYARLLAELSDRAASLDPYCRTALEPLYAANASTLDPLRQLLEATFERAKAAAIRAGGPNA